MSVDDNAKRAGKKGTPDSSTARARRTTCSRGRRATPSCAAPRPAHGAAFTLGAAGREPKGSTQAYQILKVSQNGTLAHPHSYTPAV